jgi:hypothetical protein
MCGAAIAVRAWQSFAAAGLAGMFFGWLVVLHLPLCAAHPRSQALWASALVVVALCGGSLVLAAGEMRPRSVDTPHPRQSVAAE